MVELFKDYNIVLMDASYFVAPFSDSLREALLMKGSVWVAPSFEVEENHLLEILSGDRKRYYKDNIDFIKKNIKVKYPNMDTVGFDCRGLGDTWGLVNFCVSLSNNLKSKLVVITSNELLISRISLHGLTVDVYNLNDNTIRRYLDVKRNLSGYEDSPIVNDAVDRFDPDSVTLYSKMKRIKAGELISEKGAEAYTYKISGSPDKILKVFKPGELRANKLNNLKKLVGINERLKIDWAQFPDEFVYYDKSCVNPAGVVEKYIDTNTNLSSNPLFGGTPDLEDQDLQLFARQTRISDCINLCIKVVRQVYYLNCFGFYISDYNLDNFATLINQEQVIQMWDTDSFGFGDFFGEMCEQKTKLSRNYDTSNKIEAIDMCNEALCSFVITILSLGEKPIGKKGGFKFDNPNFADIWKKDLIPTRIFEYLRGVYNKERIPSPETLLFTLVQSLDDIKKQGDVYYSVLINKHLGVENHIDFLVLDNKDNEKSVQKDCNIPASYTLNTGLSRKSDSPVSSRISYRDKLYVKFLTNGSATLMPSENAIKHINQCIKEYAPSVNENEVFAVMYSEKKGLIPIAGKSSILFTKTGIYGNLTQPLNGLFKKDKQIEYESINDSWKYDDGGYNVVIQLVDKSQYVAKVTGDMRLVYLNGEGKYMSYRGTAQSIFVGIFGGFSKI